MLKISITVSGKSGKEEFAVDKEDLLTYFEEEFGYDRKDVAITISKEE